MEASKYISKVFLAEVKKDIPRVPYGNSPFVKGERVEIAFWQNSANMEVTVQFSNNRKYAAIDPEKAAEHLSCIKEIKDISAEEVHKKYINSYNRAMH